MRRKLNDAAAIAAIIVLLFLIFVNFRVFSVANDFMEEYNAAGYEETYIAPKLRSDGAGVYLTSPVPIRFIFLDESGEHMMMDIPTKEAFFDINKIIQNYIDTAAFLIALYFVITLFALVMAVKDRYNISGLILLMLFGIIVLFVDPVLKFMLIPLGLLVIIGSYLTFKSRFVDYNQSRFFTFNRS